MAAIAQLEPYQAFIRKIGWSVGLENTFSRVDDLVHLYIAKRELSPGDWHSLVSHKEAGWGLDTLQIGNFFSSLELIRVQRHEIQILPCLDALALAYIELKTESERRCALKFILGSFIVLADGDIFLNFLASEFNRERSVDLLRAMVLTKRERYLKIFKSPQIANRIIRIVGIDVQKDNMGGASAGKSLSEKKRTTPLEPRTAPLSQTLNPMDFSVSADYLKKAIPKRRDWAFSLNLINEDSNLTARGQKFLQVFRQLTNSLDSSALAYWPHVTELRKLHLSPEQLHIPAINLWMHIQAMYSGLNEGVLSSAEDKAEQDFIEILSRNMQAYKNLTPKRALVRKEMPISIFFHAAAAVYLARSQPLPQLKEIIEKISSDLDSPIRYRISKNYGATLSIRE